MEVRENEQNEQQILSRCTTSRVTCGRRKMPTWIGFGKKLSLSAEAPTPQGATEMIFENSNS